MLNGFDDRFRAAVAAELGDGIFRPLTPAYTEEPRKRVTGQGGALVAPRTVSEVSSVLKMCNDARVGVVPYGGGTGLVGAQIMPEGSGPSPLILSMERMASIREVDANGNVLLAEAGVTLQAVQAAAEAVERLFPLSLASEGTCQIGGNLATNAGGVNVLRYGSARALCLGVEAVLPNGEILNNLSRLRKDNTGYDLRDLLIGSEGTLGVITAATLTLSPRPADVGTAIFTVRDPASALALLSLARAIAGDGVSAFELLHGVGLDFVAETIPEARQPFSARPEWAVLVEFGLPDAMSAEQSLTALFEQGAAAGLTEDGVIAQSDSQRAAFWTLREQIPEANKRIGAIVSHDISLPLDALADFIPRGMVRIAEIGPFRVNCFGHLGDGNLHYNVFPPKGETREVYADHKGRIERAVHDLVAEMGGSFSAEHGVGRFKTQELIRYGDPVKRAAMGAIKTALDPNGIMNPGALFG